MRGRNSEAGGHCFQSSVESGRRDLNPGPSGPKASQEHSELRHSVAFTRCSGQRCRDSSVKELLTIARDSQHNSQPDDPLDPVQRVEA